MQDHNDTLLMPRMERSVRLNTIVPSKLINCYENANGSDKYVPC